MGLNKTKLEEWALQDRTERQVREKRSREKAEQLADGLAPLTAVIQQEHRILGSVRTEQCDDCGAELRSVPMQINDWLSIFEMPDHSCPEREARLQAEREKRAQERRQWLENPPAERVKEVRGRARLPYWTPVGLGHLRVAECAPQLGAKLSEHREVWLSGKRPAQGLWIVGPTNSRKTCGLCGLLFDVAHQTQRTGLYWTWERLLKHFRLSVGDHPNEYDGYAIEAAEVLVLDDLGSAKFTEKAWEMLFDIVDTAYDGGSAGPSQTLYVTSNEDPDTFMALLDKAVPPNGGERIVRRLVQLCEVVEL